mgnify:CR=1 FL=1
MVIYKLSNFNVAVKMIFFNNFPKLKIIQFLHPFTISPTLRIFFWNILQIFPANFCPLKRVRISSTFSVLRPFSYLRPVLYFDPPTLLRPKPYFDLFGQTLLTTKTLLRPLYFDLCFSTNKKSRFDKRSKYRGRSKRVEV